MAYEDGVQDFKIGDETNNTVWINSNNMYIVEEEQVENIYHQLKNFECYSFEGTTIIDPSLDAGDIVTIDNKKVIYQGNMEYVGKFKVSIASKIQTKAKEETTRTIISDKTKIRRVQSEINQLDGRISQLVQETGEYEEKISQAEQDIDTIKQTIKSQYNFTRQAEGTTEIYLDNAIEGKIINLQIQGNKTYKSNLFPEKSLYPKMELQPNQEVN